MRLLTNQTIPNSRIAACLSAGLLLLLGAGQLYPASAHEVEVSGDVGGTMHIEPNDSPKAGTASLTWFALTRRGGQPIPLTDCNCTLSVYAQPRQQGGKPIVQPALSATSVEGHQGVPSAKVTFPRAGAYELVLQGRPVTSGTFTPFELKFPVTVAQ
jgi:hypothetical protein